MTAPAWKCVDCGELLVTEKLLIIRFPESRYKKGQYGLTEDKVFPAYQVHKCPFCRGNVQAFVQPEKK